MRNTLPLHPFIKTERLDKIGIRKNMRKTAVLAVIVAMSLMAGCKKSAVGDKPKEYTVLTVGPGSVATINKYPATIRGRQDVEIYPQVSGRITEVRTSEGQRVRRGQPLFVIDQVGYRAALQTARANLRAATAEAATAKLSCEGKQELYANKVTSAFDLRKAENTLHSAEAAVAQAKARVTEAANNLSYTVVCSPCDGVTGTIPYRAGALVGPSMSSPLTTVSDNSVMYVYFSIPENRMLALIRRYGSADKAMAAMPEVRLFLNDGSEYGVSGKVESISGVLDAETGSVSLRAAFRNPRGLLHSGGAGNVGLAERANAITIPQSATYELQDKVYAYRVVGGKAVATQIKAEPVDEQKIYVVHSGLKAGDVIVAEGVAMLKDGSPIAVKKTRKK